MFLLISLNLTKRIIDIFNKHAYYKVKLKLNLVLTWLMAFVTDVRIPNSYFESDPRILVTKLITAGHKIARFRSHKPRKSPRYNTQAHINKCKSSALS